LYGHESKPARGIARDYKNGVSRSRANLPWKTITERKKKKTGLILARTHSMFTLEVKKILENWGSGKPGSKKLIFLASRPIPRLQHQGALFGKLYAFSSRTIGVRGGGRKKDSHRTP